MCGSVGLHAFTGEGGKDAETLIRAPPYDGSSGPEPERTQESFKITVIQCTEVPIPDRWGHSDLDFPRLNQP